MLGEISSLISIFLSSFPRLPGGLLGAVEEEDEDKEEGGVRGCSAKSFMFVLIWLIWEEAASDRKNTDQSWQKVPVSLVISAAF